MRSALSFIGGVHIGASALHVLNVIWFGNLSPIPVGRRGIISSLFLLAVASSGEWGRGGGGGRHPLAVPVSDCILECLSLHSGKLSALTRAFFT